MQLTASWRSISSGSSSGAVTSGQRLLNPSPNLDHSPDPPDPHPSRSPPSPLPLPLPLTQAGGQWLLGKTRTTYHLPLTTDHLPPTTYHLLLTTDYLLLTADNWLLRRPVAPRQDL
jgi:hypothetical protein